MTGLQAALRSGVAALLGAAVLLAAPLAAAKPRNSSDRGAPAIAAPVPAPRGGAGLHGSARADRMHRRGAAPAGQGVMRFGDTEVRIGGRASVGYDFSGR